jgi:CBS domain-containing protein
MSPENNNFYELIYHPKAKYFIKKFNEGIGTQLFKDVLNMSDVDAKKVSGKLSNAVNSYSHKLYDNQIRSRRYKKSYSNYVNQPDIIAYKMAYILNTLASNYSDSYFKFYIAVTSHVYQFDLNEKNQKPIKSGNTHRITEIQEAIVKDLMIPAESVILIDEESTVKDFFGYFVKYGYHGYPVINKLGTIIGTISYWHIRKRKAVESDLVRNIMYRISENDPIKISEDVSVEEAYERVLANGNFTRLFVYSNRNFLGLLSKSAIVRAVATRGTLV